MYDPYHFHHHQQQSNQQQLVWTDTSANLCKGLGRVDINIHTYLQKHFAQSHLSRNYAVDLHHQKHGSDFMSVLSLHCAVLCNKESWRHRVRAASLKLSMIERGLHMDGWLLHVRLCTHPKISPESNPMMIYGSLLSETYKLRSPSVDTHAKRSHTHIRNHTVYIRVQWILGAQKEPSMHYPSL